MRGLAELLWAAFDGLARKRPPAEHSAPEREAPSDELPPARHSGPLDERLWISDRPRRPRERPRIISNIREHPRASVGDLSRPAALGTLLEGAMAFALDDAVDGRCEWLEIDLLDDGSASVTHGGPGFSPERAAGGLQRWPWLRRSLEGEIFLTQNLAAPVVTCALSHWCRLEVHRRDGLWRQAFYRGEPECALERKAANEDTATYTRVHFRPDPEIFADRGFDIDDLYMRTLGFLTELPMVEIRIRDQRGRGVSLTMLGTG
jgi:hypothetical protein